MSAGPQFGHPLANGDDFTSALDPREVRRLRTACECAARLRNVDEVDACGADPDQELSRPWARYGGIGDQA